MAGANSSVVPSAKKPRLDENTAADASGKTSSTSPPSAVRGNCTCASFDDFKGANASFLNNVASEPAEEYVMPLN